MTQETLREAVARGLCELHIRTVRRHDTPPDELEAKLPGSVDYAWRDFIPQADAAIATMFERLQTPHQALIIDLAASLAAAISLLERGGKAAKKAAPSDKMFDQMVEDYKASLNRARKALTAFQQENSDAI